MKKAYTCGEILLALREEYMGCMDQLDELKELVKIKTQYDKYYFSG